jgi:indolepyruvate ferredoxin oxidoreductase
MPTVANPDRPAASLDHRFLQLDGEIYLTGIQALVRTLRDRALLDARRNLRSASFVSGYEGSPLAGYDMEIARRQSLLTDVEIVHRPAVNEELAATSVAGTQLAGQIGSLRPDGVTGYWYGKAPGLDRAADAIRHANLIGTDPQGGAVALIGDDPAAKSSTYPCSSEAAVADLYLPTLYPADSQEVLDYATHAAYLSRFTGTWAGLKIVTAVADGASVASVHPDRVAPTFGDIGKSTHRPSAQLIGTNLAALEESLLTRRFPRAVHYARLNGLNTIQGAGTGARIGIIASGKTYLDLREALTRLGVADLHTHGLRLLKLGMVYPVDPEIVRTFADGLTEIIVVEEKRAFLETAVKEILYRRADAPMVTGKEDERGRRLFPAAGELDVDRVMIGLARRLAEGYGVEPAKRWLERPQRSRIELPLMTRTPYFCSGCPHSSSTKADKHVLVGGGIGCHALVMVMDEEQTGRVVGLTQMGGEGAQWIGMAPFLDDKHFVQNVGDGTFMHSGSLALRAAVAAGVNITYKLLYNSAVAMTGGQSPTGAMPLRRLVELLNAEGVTEIVVTSDDVRRTAKQLGRRRRSVTIRHRDDIAEVQQHLATVPGVTVLVHDQECAAEKRRKRKRGMAETPTERVAINQRICEGCGDCGVQSNCLSVRPVQTEFGRKTEIHQSSCNLDFSCLRGDCPSFVTVIPRGEKKQHVQRVEIDEGALQSLPEPDGDIPDNFAMRIVGVGGTGIVTIAQVIATAGAIDGKYVRSLDQTGLAQKGGAVVSDLKISTEPIAQASKISAESCDLYLVCDVLVGTDNSNLRVTSEQLTTSVVSSAQIPTGQMVVDTSIAFPDADRVHTAIDDRSRRSVYLDAGAVARDAFGDEQYSNMLMVGVAFQAARLPVSVAAMELAIRLNGAAVEKNIQAFRRGRHLAVADHPSPTDRPDQTRPANRSAVPFEWRGVSIDEETSKILHLMEKVRGPRFEDLVKYQGKKYAQRYRSEIASVWQAERRVAPGSRVLAEAAARYLYKLMAYKDEYEVARLALDESFTASLKDQFGAASKISVRLHPPVLRALGMKQKISLGPWFVVVLRLLHAMRWLRGTALDVFGYAKVRRTERDLIEEYIAALRAVCARLTGENLAAAVAIAELPDMVRGYEQIKLANVEKYRERLNGMLTEFGASAGARC